MPFINETPLPPHPRPHTHTYTQVPRRVQAVGPRERDSGRSGDGQVRAVPRGDGGRRPPVRREAFPGPQEGTGACVWVVEGEGGRLVVGMCTRRAYNATVFLSPVRHTPLREIVSRCLSPVLSFLRSIIFQASSLRKFTFNHRLIFLFYFSFIFYLPTYRCSAAFK